MVIDLQRDEVCSEALFEYQSGKDASLEFAAAIRQPSFEFTHLDYQLLFV